MVSCVCSVDTDERTECIALDWKWYIKMIREKKCGTEQCPFWKPREEKGNDSSNEYVRHGQGRGVHRTIQGV